MKWQRLRTVIKHYQAAEISKNAVVSTYYTLLSVFPLLIFLGNLLALLKLPVSEVLRYVAIIVPKSLYPTIAPLIRSLLTQGNGGLLSIGAVVTLWSASKGVVTLRQSVNQVYEIKTPQNALLSRLISLVLTLLFLIVVVSLVVIFGFGQDVLNYLAPRLNLPQHVLTLFGQFKLPVVGPMLLLILALLQYWLPQVKLHLRCVWPGALLTAVGWLALAQFFALYLRYFARSVTSYGTLSTFIILLFWLNFLVQFLLLGCFLTRLLETHFYGSPQPVANHLTQFMHSKSAPDQSSDASE